MDTIFSVNNSDIEKFNPDYVVELFRDLLMAEAKNKKIPLRKISITTRINVRDGGIDAKISDNEIENDLIKPGNTYYQIKSGKDLATHQLSFCKELLFGKSIKDEDISEDELSDMVKQCFDDKKGTYVLLCTHSSITPQNTGTTVATIKSILERCGYNEVNVEVWDIENFIGYLNNFPPFCLRVNGRGGAYFQTHRSWLMKPGMKHTYQKSESIDELIKKIREQLSNQDQFVHIRITGQSGIGKTRVALESTEGVDFSTKIIYLDSPQKFGNTELERIITNYDDTFHIILVVDDCDRNSAGYIDDKIRPCGSRVKLITIYTEVEDVGQIFPINMPAL